MNQKLFGLVLMAVSAFFFVCLCFFVFAIATSRNQDKIQTSQPTDGSGIVEPLEPALSYEEIRGNANTMTDAQWNQYTESLKGLSVIDWEGWITDVNEKTFGGYEVQIDMEPPVGITTYDVHFDISDELALTLEKEQKIRFSGQIDQVNNVFSMNLVFLLNNGTLTVLE